MQAFYNVISEKDLLARNQEHKNFNLTQRKELGLDDNIFEENSNNNYGQKIETTIT